MSEAIEREALLIQQARGGDIRSFSALVEMYQERSVHIAYSFLGNFEDARDIAQESFVKAYENLQSFKAESKFYTWFYRILANTCKDFLRKKRTRWSLMAWLPPAPDSEEDPMNNVADTAKDARASIANEELGNEIYRALDKLPFQQKNAFSLRYLEGMNIEDIAESMGLTAGAVKAHLWQAGQKMQKYLKRFSPIGG